MTTFQKYLLKHPKQIEKIWPTWNDYIPCQPTGKQLAFLLLPHSEAFFGGAAGGGKTSALLMAALQYVHIPQYSAIILRRSFSDLEQPDALIPRSHEWLSGTDARWDPQQHRWRWPNGSALQFGFMGEFNAHQRYQGAAYQFVGFDELAQHMEDDYLYMFSRRRKLICPIHKLDEDGKPIYKPDCPDCQIRSQVPLRTRATSNPPRAGDAGRSDNWVRERFQIRKVGDIYRGTHPTRAYIPSFIKDNPYIDQESYISGLNELDPVTRAQLLQGDWGVSEEGRFRKSWSRFFRYGGEHITLLDKNGAATGVYPLARCRIFQTVDPAGSVKEGPGDRQIYARKQASWTVIATWLLTPKYDLLWWDCRRFKKEVPDIFPELRDAYRKHRPEFVGIEANGFNHAIFQMANRMGLPVQACNPRSQDKLVRATPAAVRMEQGKVYFPLERPAWLDDVETELFTWTGHKDETADVVDVFAYAAIYVNQISSMGGFFGIDSHQIVPGVM